MRVRIKWGRLEPRPELLELFGAAEAPRRSRALPMLCSTAAHSAVVILLPLLANANWAFSRNNASLSLNNQVEWMRLRVPETIFYSPPPKAPRAKTRPSGQRAEPRREPARAQTARASVRQFEAPKLELPAPSRPALMAAPILQPTYRKNKTDLAKSLPALAYWAPVEAPKPVRKAFVAPGRTEAAREPASMAAAPVLAIPNREAALRDLNIGPAPPIAAPTLPISPSATAPIRDKTGEATAGTLNSAEGQAANVIILSEKRAQADQEIAVPKGLQNIPKAESARESGSGAADQNKSVRVEAGSGGPNPARAAVSRSTERTAGGAGSSSQPATAKPAITAPAASGEKPGVARIAHPPNGTFDVVVMQAQAVDDLPESKARLSGSPIYTVYLEVGDKKRWLLEFCAPRDTKATSSFEVYIESGAADEGLTPPYPISTAVPDAIFRNRPKPAIFHGYLTASGRFRNLEARDANPALAAELNPLLSEWRFRPAGKNKVPVEVEVLLVVPAVGE
jgi:hypothetical protein